VHECSPTHTNPTARIALVALAWYVLLNAGKSQHVVASLYFLLPHLPIPSNPIPTFPVEESASRTRAADVTTSRALAVISSQVVAILRDDRSSAAFRALYSVGVLPLQEFSSCCLISCGPGNTVSVFEVYHCNSKLLLKTLLQLRKEALLDNRILRRTVLAEGIVGKRMCKCWLGIQDAALGMHALDPSSLRSVTLQCDFRIFYLLQHPLHFLRSTL